jgi:uncharacterized protein YheU (UPF0270 family)
MPTHIEVPQEALSPEAVVGLIEEFITREGTDYGVQEHSLEQKRTSVLKLLERREIAIVFDFASESTMLVSRQVLRQLGQAPDSELERD